MISIKDKMIWHWLQGEIYSGAIFMQQLLGWNLYLCVIIILVVTGIYTVAGKIRLECSRHNLGSLKDFNNRASLAKNYPSIVVSSFLRKTIWTL
jgi:hypothetical protein